MLESEYNKKTTRFIAIDPDIFDHPTVGAHLAPPKPADPKHYAVQPLVAWMQIIAAAAWKTHRVTVRRHAVELQRGELLAARAYWSGKWNWGEQAVRSFFNRLAEDGMISINNQQPNRSPLIISICNYEKYQTPKGRNNQQPNHETTSEQPADNQQATIEQPYNTRDNTNLLTFPPSAREPEKVCKQDLEEIEGLGADTELWVDRLATSLNQLAPDRITAHRLLQSDAKMFGGEALQRGLHDLDCDLATGRVDKLNPKQISRYAEMATRQLAKQAHEKPRMSGREALDALYAELEAEGTPAGAPAGTPAMAGGAA